MNKYSIDIAKKTLLLLTKKSWEEISLDEVLRKIKNQNKEIKSKTDLLKNINSYVDYNLKNEVSSIEKSDPKDMLFEVIMARFDVLQRHRNSFLKLFKSFKFEPQKFLFMLPPFLESMFLISSLAKIKIQGLQGSIKIKGIFIIYIATCFNWAKDDTQSLEKTMTSLDKYLNQSSKILKFINK